MDETAGFLKGVPTGNDLQELFALNYDEVMKIQEEFPATYGYYSTISAKAAVTRLKAKFDLDIVAADVAMTLREDALASGKKMTDKAVDASVKLSGMYKEAYNNFLQAEEASRVLQAIVDSLKIYSTCLTMLAKYQTEEMAVTTAKG